MMDIFMRRRTEFREETIIVRVRDAEIADAVMDALKTNSIPCGCRAADPRRGTIAQMVERRNRSNVIALSDPAKNRGSIVQPRR
jgi:hypothetical protein